MMMFRPPKPLLAGMLGCLMSIPASAWEAVTLADPVGRELSGDLAGFRNRIVHLRLPSRRMVEVPWDRLSPERQKLVENLVDEGKVPGGVWPERGPIPVPYRFEADGTTWTGNHVKLIFPVAPKTRANSTPEAQFLKTLDTVIAAVKAMPLGDAVDQDKMFECVVLPNKEFNDLRNTISARNRPRSPRPDGTFTFTRRFSEPAQCVYDEVQEKAFVDETAVKTFLESESMYWRVPLSEQDRSVRRAAAYLAFGKSWGRIPVELQPAILGYLQTIDEVAGPGLDYAKIPAGLRKLVRVGVTRLQGDEFVPLKPAVDSAEYLLRSSRDEPTAADEVNSILIAYYLLHFDGEGDGLGFHAALQTIGGGQANAKNLVDSYNKAVGEWKVIVTAFNAKVDKYNQDLANYKLALARETPGAALLDPGEPPKQPLPPPILTRFPNPEAIDEYIKSRREAVATDWRRGRTRNEAARDFRRRMDAVLQ